jgi:hypothetical protein
MILAWSRPGREREAARTVPHSFRSKTKTAGGKEFDADAAG